MDLQKAFEQADADLRRAERQMEGLARRIETLRAERLGLELALARHGNGTPAPDREADPATMPRTDAILHVMAEQGTEPVSAAQVTEWLARLGRKADTRHSVGAALSYLRNQGKVQLQGRGQWVLAAPPLSSTRSTEILAEPALDDDPVPDDAPEPEDFVSEYDLEEPE